MSTVKKNEARKRGREWWIPILAGDFKEDLSEEVAYRDMNEVTKQAFQVIGTKNAKTLMQEYTWKILGNVRRPV